MFYLSIDGLLNTWIVIEFATIPNAAVEKKIQESITATSLRSHTLDSLLNNIKMLKNN